MGLRSVPYRWDLVKDLAYDVPLQVSQCATSCSCPSSESFTMLLNGCCAGDDAVLVSGDHSPVRLPQRGRCAAQTLVRLVLSGLVALLAAQQVAVRFVFECRSDVVEEFFGGSASSDAPDGASGADGAAAASGSAAGDSKAADSARGDWKQQAPRTESSARAGAKRGTAETMTAEQQALAKVKRTAAALREFQAWLDTVRTLGIVSADCVLRPASARAVHCNSCVCAGVVLVCSLSRRLLR